MKYICPSCERTIYNRRLTNCEFCSTVLPRELLFSESDIERLDKQHQDCLTRKSKINSNSSSSSIDITSSDFGDCGGCD